MLFASSVCEITVYDAHYLWEPTVLSNSAAHEHMALLAALGGLVNRNGPSLFVNSTESDSYWLDRLTRPSEWLGDKTLTVETDLGSLVSKFSSIVRGVVLFDADVPSTSNLALSIAGMEDLLPIMSGGVLHQLLCLSGPHLPVMRSLVGLFNGSRSGSAKNDAYLWFRDNFMTGSTNLNPTVQGINSIFLNEIYGDNFKVTLWIRGGPHTRTAMWIGKTLLC